MKYRPELIAITGLVIFCVSLFMDDSKIQASMQIASSAITGYFGFISANLDEK